MLNETIISKAIIETYMKRLTDFTETEVAIVGGGPSGLVCAYHLAKAGIKTAVFEKKLSIGGGIWGGGMMFNEVVIQKESRSIAEIFGLNLVEYKPGYFTVSSVEMASKITAHTIDAGAKVFNLIEIEDVVVKSNKVAGLVINWSPVKATGLHVDPLMVASDIVVDSTGHPSAVVSMLAKRGIIETPKGEAPLDSQNGETMTVENTSEIFPSLYVTGMSACGFFGSPRMGPIFGGMLLSGKKAADDIIKKLR
jgi:thiamine thiazole synthase